MSQQCKSSIEFMVDEEAGALLGHERTEVAAGQQSSVEEILRLPLADLRSREPGELQRSLGRLVLTFLDSRSAKGLGLPRDLEDEKNLDEQHFLALERSVDQRNPQTVYDLAVSLIGRGMAGDSWADIEKGEALLSQAADAGVTDAIKYREEVWSLVRPRLERKLKPD